MEMMTGTLCSYFFPSLYHGSWPDSDFPVSTSSDTKVDRNCCFLLSQPHIFHMWGRTWLLFNPWSQLGPQYSMALPGVCMRCVLLLFHHSCSCLYCWNVQFLQLPFFLFALFQSLWLNSGSKHWIVRSLTLHVLLFVLSCTVQQLLIYLLFLPPFSLSFLCWNFPSVPVLSHCYSFSSSPYSAIWGRVEQLLKSKISALAAEACSFKYSTCKTPNQLEIWEKKSSRNGFL